MTKSDALILASEHKDKSSAVLVTADGNVFFAEHKNHAFHHAKEKNIEVFEFLNEDLNSKKETRKSVEKIDEEIKPTKKTK